MPAYHRELVAEFPPTILDLLHLQGVGPKTVATLYRELGIRTLDDLQQAATDGRIRSLRGMGAKKEALILKALEERQRHAGRHLLSDAHDAAAALVGYLRERAPAADIEPVGSLRRGCDTCGDLDILASGAGVADGRLRRPTRSSSACSGTATRNRASSLAAVSRRICGWSPARAAAPRCSISPDRRRTTSPFATARSASASS